MEGKPGEGPEAMDVTLSCPAIWPMLLVAMLVAMETLLRFMPLPLYMLLLFCWVNCGDACCCENILWRGEEKQTKYLHYDCFKLLENVNKYQEATESASENISVYILLICIVRSMSH